MPSEDDTASPGLSHTLWGELENFPSKYFHWGPLRQNPDPPPNLLISKGGTRNKTNIITYRLDIRGEKKFTILWLELNEQIIIH